jgi:quercetin dioxygenase-like cupin family protein
VKSFALRAGQSLPLFSGLKAGLKAGGEDTSGGYCLIEVPLSPGEGPEPHIHEAEDEAFFVLEGEEVFQLGSDEVSLGVGAFVFVARGTLHTHRNASDRPSRTLAIFTPAGIERFFPERAALQARGGSAEELAALRERFHIRYPEAVR